MGAGEIYRDKTSRKVMASPGAVDHDAHFDNVARAVVRLFRNKASKSYPPNTVLIISFDEIKLFGHYSWNQMLSRVAAEGGLSGSAFRSIYLFNIATNRPQKKRDAVVGFASRFDACGPDSFDLRSFWRRKIWPSTISRPSSPSTNGGGPENDTASDL